MIRKVAELTRRILPHTADTGVEAQADTFPDLIVELATGMFESMAAKDPELFDLEDEIEVAVIGPTREDIVVEVLSELLYESEVENLFLYEFGATGVGTHGVKVKARGVPFSAVELTGPPIKAVTYHDLEVVETDDGFSSRVYFDV